MSAQRSVLIKNAHTHNLKGIDVSIPYNKLVVITGVSGSGKSSLAYDTLYAEGHRKYVESLSSYARQFVERLPKPPVDYIKGLAPCIALEQKVTTNNPRSTVGTATEIYDYLRVLFARVGSIIHPITGKKIKRYYPQDVVHFIQSIPIGTVVYIANNISISNSKKLKQDLEKLLQSGFSRVLINHQLQKISEVFENLPKNIEHCFLIIDRSIIGTFDEDTVSRLYDSVETAYNQGNGTCYIITQTENEWDYHEFKNILEVDGITFEEPTPQLFAFNNPYGICQECKGTGRVVDFDPDKVFKSRSLSIHEGALISSVHRMYYELESYHVNEKDPFILNLHKKPIADLSEEEFNTLWYGDDTFIGIRKILKEAEGFSYHRHANFRDIIFSYLKSNLKCHLCKGFRLRREALYIKILGYSIADFVEMPIDELLNLFKNKISQEIEHKDAVKNLLVEIISRLQFLCDVGLSYLTLNREMRTLSGGESQRVYLTTALGSSLVGSIYVLDEPTTGLHSRDTKRLISALKKLRDEGNTVVLVEHDEEVMRNADMIIDMGPKAGKEGGNIVFQGSIDELKSINHSLTANYLFGKKDIKTYSSRRSFTDFVYLKNASANNLKNIDVQFPFNAITCITGVSGSGKSSLVELEIIPEFENVMIHHKKSEKLSGSYAKIKKIYHINQDVIRTSSRSNCVTYTKVYDDIRFLFFEYSKLQGIKLNPSYFSFNTMGGRCEKCQGEGIIRIPMQFMADIEITCDECNGKRFSKQVLQVDYYGYNISDVLEMTVEEAYALFDKEKQFIHLKNKILNTLNILRKVGLGYLPLGQSTTKMSGGELQRLKIATFLQDEKADPSLFIFDEPTTGLHFYDIDILMNALQELIVRGHTIIIVEHQLDVIKNADWVIDLGPEGGTNGGNLVYQGNIERFLECEKSHTSRYLRQKFVMDV